jgi:hypothetical protein
LLVLAELAGLTIRTFPVTGVEDPDTRVNIPKTVLEDLRGLARLRRTAKALVRAWKESQTPQAAGTAVPAAHWHSAVRESSTSAALALEQRRGRQGQPRAEPPVAGDWDDAAR